MAGTDVIQLVAKLSADAGNFVKELGKATKANRDMVHDMANKTKDIASSVAVGAGAVGAAIAGGLALSASKAQEVQNALGEVASLGVKDLGSLKDAAVNFSNNWAGTTAPEFIRSAYDIKSAVSTLSDEAVAKFTEFSALTAKATKASAGEMSAAFTTAYGIFKPLSKDMSDMDWADKFAGVMSGAVQQFKTDGKQMADAIKSIGAIASASNVPLTEQVAILGTLQQTMPGAEAGTQYKAFMMTAATAGEKMGLAFTNANGTLKSTPEILELIKKKFPDLSQAAAQMKLKEAFGSEEAVKYVLQLTPKIDQLKAGIDSMGQAWERGSAGAREMAEAMNTDTPELLKQQLGNLMAMVGEFVLVAIGPLMKDVSAFIIKLQEWIAANPELAAGLTKAAVVAGAVLLAIAGIATVIAGIAGAVAVFTGAAFVAMAPVLGIIAIVVGVIAALGLLANVIYQNWEPIKGFFVEMWEVIKYAFVSAWEFIKLVVVALWEGLKEIFTLGPAAIGKQLGEWVMSLGKIIGEGMSFMVNVFKAGWEWVKGIFVAAWEGLKNGWSVLWEPAQRFIDLLKGGFNTAWDLIKQGFENFKGNMMAGWEAFKAGPKSFIDWMRNLFVSAFENILAMFTDLWNKIKDIPGMLVDKAKDAFGMGEGNPPGMAAGGIVRRPTIARVGEAGPEAVIPLNGGAIPVKLSDDAGSSGGSGGGAGSPPLVVHVHQQPGEDGQTLAKRVAEHLKLKQGWT